jgi:hypothetical protein
MFTVLKQNLMKKSFFYEKNASPQESKLLPKSNRPLNETNQAINPLLRTACRHFRRVGVIIRHSKALSCGTSDQGSEVRTHRSKSPGKKRRLQAHLPDDHGVLVGALPPLLRVETRRRARAVGAHPPGDPRELVLRHLSPASGELLAAAGEGATCGRALPPPAVPLPPRRHGAGGGGL